MADLWYYARDGKQQGPVGSEELKRLAAAGQLRPTDLVWKDGMADWLAAAKVRGLFPAAVEAVSIPDPVSRPLEAGEEEVLPRSRPRARIEDEDDSPRRRPRRDFDDDDEDFDRPRRRRKRRQGLGTGAIVAIIVGSGVGLIVLVAGVILAIVAGTGGDNSRSFHLQDSQVFWFNVTFHQGKRVEIWVKSQGNSDVDLYVLDANGRQIARDDGDSKDCYVSFVPDRTQSYRVEVRNMHRIDQLWRNGPNNGTVEFKES
jgi:hypothetical protein